jgi:hypothetical protein
MIVSFCTAGICSLRKGDSLLGSKGTDHFKTEQRITIVAA